MVELEQMLQSASFLVWDGLDIVDSDGLDVDGSSCRCPAKAELGHGQGDLSDGREHVYRSHSSIPNFVY